MAEKTNAQLLKELKAKLKIGSKGGALSNERVAYSKWLAANTGIKLLPNGKKETVWKTGPNKGKVFDKSTGSKQFLKGHYGTETPRKDYEYLKESELSRQRFDVQKGDSIRTRLSQKDYEGKNIYQQEVAARQSKDQLRLNQLRSGTSFARQDKANASADLLATLDQKQDAAIEETGKKLDGKNKPNNNKPLIPGQEVGRGTWVNGRWVDQGTSKPLMSSFRENASDQARHNLKVKQDSGETTYKSDVFTIDPKTGEALGVMSQARRNQWDADNQKHLQEWAEKNKDKLRVYKNKGGMVGAHERTGAG